MSEKSVKTLDCLWSVPGHSDEGIYVVNNGFETGIFAADEALIRYYNAIKTHDGKRQADKFYKFLNEPRNSFQHPQLRFLQLSGVPNPKTKCLLLPPIDDVDGNLSLSRRGDGIEGYFSEENAVLRRETTDYYGMNYLATAMHLFRWISMESRFRNQVDCTRIPIFLENGQKICFTYEREDAGTSDRKYDYLVLERPMSVQVQDVNNKLKDALLELGELCHRHNFVMFPNLDKTSKITMEMLTNGKEADNYFISQVVVPFLKNKYGWDIHPGENDNYSFSIDAKKFNIGATKDSGEFDHIELPTKYISRYIIREGYLKITAPLHRPSVHGRIISQGSGDSPFSSDPGIAQDLGGDNLGLFTNPKRESMDNKRLMDVIREDTKKGYECLTMPVFSEDGAYKLANADVVTFYQRLVRQGMNCVKIVGKNAIESFQEALLEVALSHGLSTKVLDTKHNPSDAKFADMAVKAEFPYKVPDYITREDEHAFLTGVIPENAMGVIDEIKRELKL